MFDEIRECLDRYEKALKRMGYPLTEEEKNTIEFFDVHLAEEIIRNFGEADSESIAKIILAHLGMSNEIKIKIE